MEKFNWDIAHVLQNRDFSLLQELVSHWSNIRANTNVQVEGAKAHNFGTYAQTLYSLRN